MLLFLFSCSALSDFAAPWTATHQASLSFTVSQNLFKLMSVESMLPSNHLTLCLPLLLLPSILPSIRVFSSESALCITGSKYWNFSFNINLSDEYSAIISCRIDWFDFLGVQESLKHHNSKASIFQHFGLFMAHLSHHT